MIKRFSVTYDYKNNTVSSKNERGDPEVNFENDISAEMKKAGITDDDIISITTKNGIVFDFFYKTKD
jgi:hypothetical protein